MPSIPKHGTAGGIDTSGSMKAGAPDTSSPLKAVKAVHNGGSPPVGVQDHGAPSPSHGAGGGYSIDHPWRGNPERASGKTGLTTNDPEFGTGPAMKKVGTIELADARETAGMEDSER